MNDIVRIGKISTINYEKGTASVVYPDRNNEPSPDFPFFSTVYDMPKVNDMVVVLLLPNSKTKGFILGVPWSRSKIPGYCGKGIVCMEFSDGAYFKYDECTKCMEISARNIVCKNIVADSLSVDGTIKAGTIEAAKLEAESLAVSESAIFTDLKVSGTADIANLRVSGTAAGRYPD